MKHKKPVRKLIKLKPTSPYYSMASSTGYVLEYRLIMAMSLGRPLTSNEIVHHIDGNPTNNDISNLYLTSITNHELLTKRDMLRNGIHKMRTEIIPLMEDQLIDIEKQLQSEGITI